MMQNEHDDRDSESDSGDQEFEHFEQVLKKVLAVPKSEIDAKRKAEKPPPRKTA